MIQKFDYTERSNDKYSTVLSLKRVVTATTTVIINPFGVPVEATNISSTRKRNKIQNHLRKLHTLTLKRIQHGKVATGKWLDIWVLVCLLKNPS